MMVRLAPLVVAGSVVAAALGSTPRPSVAACPAHDGAVGAQPRPPAAGAARTAKTQTPPAKAAAGGTASLDLAGLEKRLRDTKAIGVFTKLALKNEVDDLLEQFKEYHQGRSRASLDDLRERYNLLMLKVLSLLQRDDPPLARDLTASRDAIWAILVDPVKFSTVTGGG